MSWSDVIKVQRNLSRVGYFWYIKHEICRGDEGPTTAEQSVRSKSDKMKKVYQNTNKYKSY
jgi:hypothetical protein